jgi:hypothetical protein
MALFTEPEAAFAAESGTYFDIKPELKLCRHSSLGAPTQAQDA